MVQMPPPFPVSNYTANNPSHLDARRFASMWDTDSVEELPDRNIIRCLKEGRESAGITGLFAVVSPLTYLTVTSKYFMYVVRRKAAYTCGVCGNFSTYWPKGTEKNWRIATFASLTGHMTSYGSSISIIICGEIWTSNGAGGSKDSIRYLPTGIKRKFLRFLSLSIRCTTSVCPNIGMLS